MVGDSAGGNLVAALTVMAIQRNFRVPDGIIMAYPVLEFGMNHFNPSLLLSLDDALLPYPFLKMCSDCTKGNYENLNHPLISPMLASDEVLKKFPPTRIMSAQSCPFRDDSIKFTLRLAQLGKDVILKEFSLLTHGFLSFNIPVVGMKDESMAGIQLGK